MNYMCGFLFKIQKRKRRKRSVVGLGKLIWKKKNTLRRIVIILLGQCMGNNNNEMGKKSFCSKLKDIPQKPMGRVSESGRAREITKHTAPFLFSFFFLSPLITSLFFFSLKSPLHNFQPLPPFPNPLFSLFLLLLCFQLFFSLSMPFSTPFSLPFSDSHTLS